MAVQLAADLRPSADGSAVRTSLVQPAVAKLQAASVLIARAAAPWDRQTDGRIAVSLNAPPPLWHNKSTQSCDAFIGHARNRHST